MKLSETLNKYLKTKKLTVSQLAKKSGVPQSTIFGWVHHDRSVKNIDDLKKVCDVLEVALHQILYGEPDPYESSSEELLQEIFSGDVKVTLHRIIKKPKR
jgi:transcriptional regulator with XRE-family HTH domain